MGANIWFNVSAFSGTTCERFLASEENLREKEKNREDEREKYREFAEEKEKYYKVKTVKGQGSSDKICG
jgi:formylmethanofuran dehydrogenase subunit E